MLSFKRNQSISAAKRVSLKVNFRPGASVQKGKKNYFLKKTAFHFDWILEVFKGHFIIKFSPNEAFYEIINFVLVPGHLE